MIYCDESHTTSGGQWWCPFPREWVEQMKRSAKCCEQLTCKEIDAAVYRLEDGMSYKLPPGDFLEEEQDARGLPLSWCAEEDRRFREYPVSCCEIYDYNTVPDVVITNGVEDWPLRIWDPVLRA